MEPTRRPKRGREDFDPEPMEMSSRKDGHEDAEERVTAWGGRGGRGWTRRRRRRKKRETVIPSNSLSVALREQEH